MEKGGLIYKELVDSIVKISKSCVEANWVRDGEAKGSSELVPKLNALFSKLSEEEKEVLAQFVLESYSSGIHDVLCELEWYIDCKDMIITVEGEELPTTEFEGLGNDFIGRCNGWEWPE